MRMNLFSPRHCCFQYLYFVYLFTVYRPKHPVLVRLCAGNGGRNSPFGWKNLPGTVEGSPLLLWKNFPPYRGRKSGIVEGSTRSSWKDFPSMVEGFPLRPARSSPNASKPPLCAAVISICDAFSFFLVTNRSRSVDCGSIYPHARHLEPHYGGKNSPLSTIVRLVRGRSGDEPFYGVYPA
jgi:hypothetical protein